MKKNGIRSPGRGEDQAKVDLAPLPRVNGYEKMALFIKNL